MHCNNDLVNYFDLLGHSIILIGLIIGAIVGTEIDFGTVAYTDYQDDGQIFIGNVEWYDYLGATVLGGAIRVEIGYSLLYIGSFVSTSFACGGGELSVSASGIATMPAGLAITSAQILQGSENLPGIKGMTVVVG